MSPEISSILEADVLRETEGSIAHHLLSQRLINILIAAVNHSVGFGVGVGELTINKLPAEGATIDAGACYWLITSRTRLIAYPMDS